MSIAHGADCVIQAEGLSKKYRLGVISRKMLVDQLESYLARKFGRPDPHSFVHEKHNDRMPNPYDFWALRNINFEVRRGDIIGIMGKNGSGKSTLLKLLSRITAPTEGVARLKGRVASLLEVGTGFHTELTGKENVYLNGSILGLKKAEVDARYKQIVEFAEIPDFMETPVKRYSSGMRVRLAFAVAAHLDPDILILDEVLAVGDAAFQEKCLDRIEATKNSGATILFVSHSAASVRQLCTRGIVLSEGKLIHDGPIAGAVDFYTESLHLHGHGKPRTLSGTRKGELVGAVAALLARSLPGGSVLVDVPVETEDGIMNVDVAWLSERRRLSVAGKDALQGAPEICAHLCDAETDQTLFQRKKWLLFKLGAVENWHCLPTGEIQTRTFVKSTKRMIDPMPPNVLET